MRITSNYSFFFFNDTATTEIYTLSLHDALPIYYEAWLVEAMRHGDYDDWWKGMPNSVVEHIAEYEDVPVYHITGWYDSWTAQAANLSYAALSKAKKGPHKLIIGPWVHGGQGDTKIGRAS